MKKLSSRSDETLNRSPRTHHHHHNLSQLLTERSETNSPNESQSKSIEKSILEMISETPPLGNDLIRPASTTHKYTNPPKTTGRRGTRSMSVGTKQRPDLMKIQSLSVNSPSGSSTTPPGSNSISPGPLTAPASISEEETSTTQHDDFQKRLLQRLFKLGTNNSNIQQSPSSQALAPLPTPTLVQSTTAPPASINVRSLSDGNLGDYLELFKTLSEELTAAKMPSDAHARAVLEELDATLSSPSSPGENAKLRQIAPDIRAVAQSILALSLADLKKGAFSHITAKIQALQLECPQSWNGRLHLTRLLLSMAQVTRIVQHFQMDVNAFAASSSSSSFVDPVTISITDLKSIPSNVSSSSLSSAIPGEPMPLQRDNVSMMATTPTDAHHYHAVNVFFECDLNGKIEYVSASALSVLGYSPDQLTGTDGTHIMLFDDAAKWKSALQQLLADPEQVFELVYHVQRPDGVVLQMQGKGILALHPETGDPTRSVWVSRLINDKHEQTESEESDDDEGKSDTNDAHATMIHPSSSSNLAREICRICNHQIPVPVFQVHADACANLHTIEQKLNATLSGLQQIYHDVAQMLVQIVSEWFPQSPSIEVSVDHNEPASSSEESSGEIERLKSASASSAAAAASASQEQTALLLACTELLERAQLIVELDLRDSSSFPPPPSLFQQSNPLPPFVSIERSTALFAKAEKPSPLSPASSPYIKPTSWAVLHSEASQLESLLSARLERLIEAWNELSLVEITEIPDDDDSDIGSSNSQGISDDDSDLKDNKTNLEPFPSFENETKPVNLPRQLTTLASFRHRASSEELSRPQNETDLRPRSSSEDFARNSAEDIRSERNSSEDSRPRSSSGHSIPTINDFEIVKPISKGAFGRVFLAKHKRTKDYFALKVLRKADMLEKNQATNVKNERQILTRLDNPFVVKLYYSFSSEDNLYLVMEYLNGGDCASLLKNVGVLDEKWAKAYAAEVVLALEYLHSKGIVHRDLKPDNLLIDQHGHLKLTDFGLSRIGFIGRSTRAASPTATRRLTFGSVSARPATMRRQSSNAEGSKFKRPPVDDWCVEDENSKEDNKNSDGKPVVAGTPDYLAPEAILGLSLGPGVDWWALGVILYEFLYGIPPFNDDDPVTIFENILNRKLDFREAELNEGLPSESARDLINGLLQIDVAKRLGSRGATEITMHPFFAEIQWTMLADSPASFIPKPSDTEDTVYFDDRGATIVQLEQELLGRQPRLTESSPSSMRVLSAPVSTKHSPSQLSTLSATSHRSQRSDIESSETKSHSRSISDTVTPYNGNLSSEDSAFAVSQAAATAGRILRSSLRLSPEMSDRSSSTTPDSKEEFGDFTYKNVPLLQEVNREVARRLSEAGQTLPNFIASAANPTPTKSRTLSLPSSKRARRPTNSPLGIQTVAGEVSRMTEDGRRRVLVVESNPILSRVLQTILKKANCQVTITERAEGAVLAATSSMGYSVIFMDVASHGGADAAARLIRSVEGPNKAVPIIAMAYEKNFLLSNSFEDVLMKPFSRSSVLEKLDNWAI